MDIKMPRSIQYLKARIFNKRKLKLGIIVSFTRYCMINMATINQPTFSHVFKH